LQPRRRTEKDITFAVRGFRKQWTDKGNETEQTIDREVTYTRVENGSSLEPPRGTEDWLPPTLRPVYARDSKGGLPVCFHIEAPFQGLVRGFAFGAAGE